LFDKAMMTPEQLMNEAKKHLSKVHRPGGEQISEAEFPKVKFQDTAMITFESDDPLTARVCVLLERDSGRLVTIMHCY
jgi:hypothetical protein